MKPRRARKEVQAYLEARVYRAVSKDRWIVSIPPELFAEAVAYGLLVMKRDPFDGEWGHAFRGVYFIPERAKRNASTRKDDGR